MDIPRKHLESHAELRARVHREMDAALQKRLATNPHPTEEEFGYGALIEQLEPQVRGVLREMYRKGYLAMSSGFSAIDRGATKQMIDGFFAIDAATKTKLEAMDVQVIEDESETGDRHTSIIFAPRTVDMTEITATWDQIAALLPDTGQPAGPSMSGEFFLLWFAPEDSEKLKAFVAQCVKHRWNRFDSVDEAVLREDVARGSGPALEAAMQEIRDDFTRRKEAGELDEWYPIPGAGEAAMRQIFTP